MAHFRVISDGTKLPYGRSILDPARKLWKQLQLAEDAMLVYRIIRAPERRVHYIEVGNIDPADVPQYIEEVDITVLTLTGDPYKVKCECVKDKINFRVGNISAIKHQITRALKLEDCQIILHNANYNLYHFLFIISKRESK